MLNRDIEVGSTAKGETLRFFSRSLKLSYISFQDLSLIFNPPLAPVQLITTLAISNFSSNSVLTSTRRMLESSSIIISENASVYLSHQAGLRISGNSFERSTSRPRRLRKLGKGLHDYSSSTSLASHTTCQNTGSSSSTMCSSLSCRNIWFTPRTRHSKKTLYR